jgi:hypothetical protein
MRFFGGFPPQDFRVESIASPSLTAVAAMSDGEIGQARGPHNGNQTPEPAGDGILAIGHGATGIRLADMRHATRTELI